MAPGGLRLALALAVALACVQVRPGPNQIVGAVASTPDRHSSSIEVERLFHAQPAPGDVAKVENIHYFDLATCSLPPSLVVEPYSDEELLAALAVSRPQLYECLVDPRHRGPADETRVVLSATAAPGTGLQRSVNGSNLTRAGEQCLLDAAAVALDRLPTLPEGWPAVSAQLELVHSPQTLPTVLPRGNDLSTAAGQIRLAMPSLCPCFAPWESAAPVIVDATLTLKPPPQEPNATNLPSPPWRVSLAAVPHGAAEVASCLQGRLQQMKFNPTKVELRVPFLFTFIDSRHDGPLDGAPDWLQHKQLESVRNRRFAESTIALGARSSAARNYNALVARYGKDRSLKLPVLAQACGALVAADDRWAAALQRKLEVEQLTKNADHVAQTQESLRTVQQVRETDERACPRQLKGKEHPAPEVIQVTPFRP